MFGPGTVLQWALELSLDWSRNCPMIGHATVPELIEAVLHSFMELLINTLRKIFLCMSEL